MNNQNSSNPCQRCGRERIIQKTWVEQIDTAAGTSTLKHTLTVCPDPACQSKVEDGLARDQAQRQERLRAKEEHTQSRLKKSGLS